MMTFFAILFWMWLCILGLWILNKILNKIQIVYCVWIRDGDESGPWINNEHDVTFGDIIFYTPLILIRILFLWLAMVFVWDKIPSPAEEPKIPKIVESNIASVEIVSFKPPINLYVDLKIHGKILENQFVSKTCDKLPVRGQNYNVKYEVWELPDGTKRIKFLDLYEAICK